jgi:transcription initiation factor TFIIH subunit 2
LICFEAAAEIASSFSPTSFFRGRVQVPSIMADSDDDYVQELSSNDEGRDHHVGEPIAGSSSSRPRTAFPRSSNNKARRNDDGRDGRMRSSRRQPALQSWEGSLQYNSGDVAAVAIQRAEDLVRIQEARKRARLRQDTQPFQRGIIRHMVLVLDLSEAMLEKDMRPNRFIVMIRDAQAYIVEFFEQNPISQLTVLAMHEGKCVKVSELSGNPTEHISAIQRLRSGGGREELPKEPKGSPSLQNALDLSRAMLYHTPKHGTREVLIILGALLTNDPGDINQSIAACVKDKIHVSIIGILARLKVCQDIVSRTNEGDESGYGVAIDQIHFRELLRATTAPPVVRSGQEEIHAANLLMMGFPSRMEEEYPSLCACHGELIRGGYICPRCKTKVCSLPQTCPACSLTLILSTHLARSYHHLFPLRNWVTVSWTRAKEMGSTQCKGCLRPFPPVPEDFEMDDQQNGGRAAEKDAYGAVVAPKDHSLDAASESSRYECENCHFHFCVDCDIFCHETLFNCPGCQSGPYAEPVSSASKSKNGTKDVDTMDTQED